MSSDSINIRAMRSSELSRVVSLWNATMVADPINAQRLTQDFLLDPHFDPETFLVADAGGELVGFVLGMTARSTHPSDNAAGIGVIVGFGVAGSYRRQGIGTLLLTHLEQHWRVKGVDTIQVGPWIPSYLTPGVDESAYPGTVKFLEQHGFECGEKPVSMRALLTGYEAAGDVPEKASGLQEDGILIRPAVAEDSSPLLAFVVEHFPHWESYVRDALRAVAAVSPYATLHVAVDGEKVIGFALTRGERFGPFGVNNDYRGRGVGAVLLSRALCAMRAANVHLAYFLWTSDQTARLYQRHGFEIVRRFTMMRKRMGT